MDTLTGNDLALALTSVQHAQAWWARRKGGTFKKREVEKLKALNTKLSAILEEAYPDDPNGEPAPDDFGDDILYQPVR